MAEIKQAYTMAMDALVEAGRAAATCSNSSRAHDANCSRVCADTAELAWLGANMLARGSHFIAITMKAVAEALEVCAQQCETHGEGHCQRCAKACQEAARAARGLLGELPQSTVAAGQVPGQPRAS